jgi:hypothetical protein
MLAGSWSSEVKLVNTTMVANKGRTGAVLALLGSTAAITGCIFRQNSASSSGGAITAWKSRLTVTDSGFEQNQARAWMLPGFAHDAMLGFGGACLFIDSNMTMDSCTLSSNTAMKGGAIYLFGSEGDVVKGSDGNILTMTMHNTVLHNNTAAMGGAMVADNHAVVDMDNVTFTKNKAGLAVLEGANRLVEMLSQLSLYHGVGGAIYNAYATMHMRRSKLESNTAVLDGGEQALFGTVCADSMCLCQCDGLCHVLGPPGKSACLLPKVIQGKKCSGDAPFLTSGHTQWCLAPWFQPCYGSTTVVHAGAKC